MVRVWPVSLAVTGCFATPTRPTDSPDAAVLTGGYRRTITIEQPPVEPLQAFPVSVLLEGDADLRDKADGPARVAFTTTGGAVLPCEIVQLTATGTLEAWVVLPELPTVPLAFDLAYGADVVSPCERSAVWGDYRAVWHLSEALAGQARDSSSFGHTLFSRDLGVPQPMPGVVGNGIRLDPADGDGADELCIENAPDLQMDLQPFSYELWVNQERFLGMYDIALHKGGSNAGNAGFDLELGLDVWDAYVRDAADPENRLTISGDSGPLVNTWHHVAVVVDRTAGLIRAYRDGLQTQSEAIVVDSVSGTSPLCLGIRTQPMVGWLDEVRVHGVARGAAWFATSVANVAQRSTFMTISAEH